MNTPVWLYLLVRCLLAGAVGLLVGLPLGWPWAGVAVGLAACLAVQWIHLLRLLRWLRAAQSDPVPELPGPWGDMVSLIARLHRRKRFHKQRFLRLMRELGRSTAAMPDGVVVLNAQTEIQWYNRTAARLLGLRGRGDVGLRIENLVRQPEFVRYLCLREHGSAVTVRSLLREEQHLSLQIVPYGVGQLLMLVRDVTHQARLEAMRKDFVANASHELRSPLTVISGYLETLAADAELEPALARPLHEMRRQAERMNGIVNDLLELSRLESSSPEAACEPVDVAALMAQLRKDVLARRQHPAQVEVRAESGLCLLGEGLQIHSAFANLVDNGAKYTPAQGSVRMRWWTDARGGHFAVADTGIGIAPEHIPRLTERFYRVDAGRSRSTGGSGLGLAIVKHVLQRHGGWLEIRSEQGVGSEFTCHFPPERLYEPERAGAGAVAGAPEPEPEHAPTAAVTPR